MKLLQLIRNTIFISVIYMLVCFAVPVFAQDSQVLHPNFLVASASIPSDKMSISYYGNSGYRKSVLSDTSIQQALAYETGMIKQSQDEVKTKYKRMGDKIKMVGRHVLRYFYFDQVGCMDTENPLSMKTRVHANEYAPDDMDVNVSVNVGVNEDTNDFIINEVKVSSFGFSTYLDAVYNYRKDQINLYLSNMHLNELLLEGMKLEFQVQPEENSGAVVLNMSF